MESIHSRSKATSRSLVWAICWYLAITWFSRFGALSFSQIWVIFCVLRVWMMGKYKRKFSILNFIPYFLLHWVVPPPVCLQRFGCSKLLSCYSSIVIFVCFFHSRNIYSLASCGRQKCSMPILLHSYGKFSSNFWKRWGFGIWLLLSVWCVIIHSRLFIWKSLNRFFMT